MKIVSAIKKAFLQEENIDPKEKYSLESIQNYVEKSFDHIVKNEIDGSGIKSEDYEKRMKKRKVLISMSKKCGLGDLGAKQYFKSFISDLVTQSYGVNIHNIDYALPFNNPSTQDKYDIILCHYSKLYKNQAINELIDKYKLDVMREYEGEYMYVITAEDIDNIYSNEKIQLSFEDKLDIIVQRIYQNFKGLSVIDELRDQSINGLSIGVSGVPIDFVGKIAEMEIQSGNSISIKMSYESVWLYHKGKEIYLEFLSFGSQKELERVCKIVYKFNNPKQFSRAEGYIFNTMVDLTRVAVFRPPFAESWCAFFRKFNVDGNLNTLINSNNNEIVKEFLSFLPNGKQNVVISGPQGAGKTTLLVAMIKHLYGSITIRIWEDFFETYLRLKLHIKNILTIKNIDTVDGERGLDAFKKSNGQVTIISEAAEDLVVNYIVKVSLVASDFSMTTHHAVTADDLFQSWRNAIMRVGNFNDERSAEDQVLDVLEWDVHPMILSDGERVIERVTEFVRLDEDPFPDNYKNKNSTDEKLNTFFESTKMYFERSTGVKRYKAVNIIEYDTENKKYVVKNKISEKKKQKILKNLLPHDKIRFMEFIEKMENQIVK